MGAVPWEWESDQLLAMTTYVKAQSHGMPVNVSIDGPAHATYEEARRFTSAAGQLDMSCQAMPRAEQQSPSAHGSFESRANERLSHLSAELQALGSVQRRFRECNEQIRAEPLAYGRRSTWLELYLAGVGKGLPIETPSVRK